MSTDDTTPLFLRKHVASSPNRAAHVTSVKLAPSEAGAYAAKALNDEVSTLATTGEGRRNDQLNIAGFNLAQLVAGGYLDHGEAWHALYITGVSTGLPPAEVTATLRSAFDAGAASPRVVSQLDPAGGPIPQVTTVSLPETAAEGPEDAPEPPTLRQRFPALDWHELWADETEDEWIVEPLLPARRLVALFSPPKVGKSLLMLELAVQISRGAEVLGYRPKPRRVLYVDFENDPRGDIRARLKAMGMTPYQLTDLIYLSYPRLAKLDTYIGGLELLAICAEYDVEVVVIDTISRAVGGEENDNDTWLAFYRNCGVLLKSEGIACIRLDHTGKDASKGMRGGSAKYGDVDAVWAMTRITETTFKLECTDNRLPIAQKVLILDRQVAPRLRHTINMQGAAAAAEGQIPSIIAALNAIDFPYEGKGSGGPAAWTILKGTGIGPKSAVELAVKRRKEGDRHATFAEPWAYKDD